MINGKEHMAFLLGLFHANKKARKQKVQKPLSYKKQAFVALFVSFYFVWAGL